MNLTLSTDKKRRAFLKNATGPTNNAEVDLLNIASGSGIVDYVWLADRPGAGGGYPQFDHSIRIYTNGNSTPDMDMDLGLFFGYAQGEIFGATNLHCSHWHARTGSASYIDRYGGGFRLPIPFTNGIRICVVNLTNTPLSGVFSQVDYRLTADNAGMSIPPYTLKTVGNKWIGGRLTAAANTDYTLATIPSGNPGVVVGHSMAGRDTTDFSYLERYVALYMDGESTPSIKSSGTEDWFTGSDYFFTGQSPFSSHVAMGGGASIYNQSGGVVNGFSSLVDLYALNGGFAFSSSAILKWLQHPANTSSADYGSCTWYYRHT